MSIGPAGSGGLAQNPGLLQALYPGLDLTAFAQLQQQQQAALEAPVQSLSSQVAQLQKVSSAWSSLSTAVANLQSDAATLAQASTWTSPQASSLNTSVVTAQASSTATPGTYTVNVTQQGLQDQWLGQTESSSSQSLGLAGSFTVNGKTISVAATDSLTTIAQNINAADAGASAQVLQGSSGYQLFIGSTGDSALALTDPNGILFSTGTSGLGVAETQTGQPWLYTVNGVSAQSTTGTDSQTVPGLTLTLAGTGTTTVSVTSTTSAAEKALSQFTQDYNALQSAVSANTGKGQILQGNATAEGIMNQIDQILLPMNTSQPAGFQSVADAGLNLNLQSDNTTQLAFSTSTFGSAASSDASALQSLFTGSSGIATQLSTLLTNLSAPSTGIIAGAQSSIQSQITALDQQEGTAQQLVTMQQNALQAQFNQEMQALISVTSQKNSIVSLFSNLNGGSSSSSGSSSVTGG